MSQLNTSTSLFSFSSLCHCLHGWEDIIFSKNPPEYILMLMRSYCIEYRRNSLPVRGKIYHNKNTPHKRIHSFSAEKDDNLIIVLNTCLDYVKRHKLVRSHLKSKSIVLPLTKSIFSCIFFMLTKYLLLPAFSKSCFPEFGCRVS